MEDQNYTIWTLIFEVFTDWKPSAKVYFREYLEQALMQWPNMAIHAYKSVEIAKSQNLQNSHPAKIKVHIVLHSYQATITPRLDPYLD